MWHHSCFQAVEKQALAGFSWQATDCLPSSRMWALIVYNCDSSMQLLFPPNEDQVDNVSVISSLCPSTALHLLTPTPTPQVFLQNRIFFMNL